MSNKFDEDAYVSRWDNILIPVMLVVIFGSMIAVYALNVWAKPDCLTHDYVFCGTPLAQPSEMSHHASPGNDHEGAAGHGENNPHSPSSGDNHGESGTQHNHPH